MTITPDLATPAAVKTRHLLPALLLALLAAGCAHQRPVTAGWSAEAMAAINRFDIDGKVGFRRGDTGGSASLRWQQEGDRYRLEATGPLGAGNLRIDGTASRVRIIDNNGIRESEQPEILLADAIGWPVSIHSLSYWVRGIPAPAADGTLPVVRVEADAGGRPVRLEQQGWVVTYDRWETDGSRLLPHKIVATGGDSRVTLLIQRWTMPLPAAPDAVPATTATPAMSTPAMPTPAGQP